MKPDYNLCDKCGGKCYAPSTFLEIGHHHNGIEAVPDGKLVDLCERCLQLALKLAIGNSYESASRVLEWIKK